MVTRILVLVFATAAALLPAADPAAASVTRKLELIESGKAKPGSIFRFTTQEVNAWVWATVRTEFPEGLRQPRIELGSGIAAGSALIDFLKVRHAEGVDTNWLVAKLIQGEKLVTARARIDSANGQATVHLLKVEIGGLAVSGAALDLLIRSFLLRLYPSAKIDEPFELEHHVDRIDVTPAEVRIYIRK